MNAWTIQKLLNWITEYLTEKDVDSPRLSAEFLLSHILQISRIQLYTNFDQPVEKQELDRLHDMVKRAGEKEPVAYLTGKTEFYSLPIYLNRSCLIPRPETELLVESAIEFLRTRTGTQLALDLCAGCACVAIAIAKNVPDARIIATDISQDALSIAAKNIETHNLKQRIQLLHGDLFEPVASQSEKAKFDLIVSNPPYVSDSEFEALDKNIKDYEPRSALLAGTDGLDVYRRICKNAGDFLKPNAALILEIGCTQADAVKQLLEQAGCFTDIKIQKDFAKNNRLISATYCSS